MPLPSSRGLDGLASARIESRLHAKSELNDLGEESRVLRGCLPLSAGLLGGLNEITHSETFRTVLIPRGFPMFKCHFPFPFFLVG